MPRMSRPGRSSQSVSVTLPVRTLERIETLAARRNLTRSELIREWTVRGLAVAEREAGMGGSGAREKSSSDSQ